MPASLDRLVLRCLEKDPTRRPPTARALLDELEALAGIGTWDRAAAQRWRDARRSDR